VQSLARVARDAGALVVVDAVSSLGAVPLETDAWGLDVVVAGSQKALMTPPGSRSRRSPTVRGSGRDVRRCRATTSTGSACAPRSSPARPVHSAVTLVAPSTPPCDAPRRRA
jgi:cysteine sulfinate desulfinase/cysteine desulfurase-like protein